MGSRYVNEIVTGGLVGEGKGQFRLNVQTYAVSEHHGLLPPENFPATHKGTVKGFVLKASDGVDTVQIHLTTNQRLKVEEYHKEFVKKVKETGSLPQALDWFLSPNREWHEMVALNVVP